MSGLAVGSCFAAFCQVPAIGDSNSASASETEPDDEPDPLDSVLLASEEGTLLPGNAACTRASQDSFAASVTDGR